MCGILAIFGIPDAQSFREKAIKLAKKIRHRGPDWSGMVLKDHTIICHERLAIMDPASGRQPMVSADKSVTLAVNGEIYNHQELRAQLEEDFHFTSHSDCEVILHAYEKYGDMSFADQLRGMYAFVLHDEKTGRVLACRDHMGIIPLYIGWGRDGSLWFASEMKALSEHCGRFMQFPPGSFYDSAIEGHDKIKSWYQRDWMQVRPDAKLSSFSSEAVVLKTIRDALVDSVRSHLMTDVPFGLLLSGGLDSSLVGAINRQLLPPGTKIPSFSVGLSGSPDLAAAAQVAEILQTSHMSLSFTVQEGIDAISEAIYHLETFDVTTIRAGTPMYLLSRLVKAAGVKMVLSGEGSDEIFGGYLYFHKAPDAVELHAETVRKLSTLYMFDCLRANKATAAWGVEARVPFLDKIFMDVAMRIDPVFKLCRDSDGKPRIEKWLLRKAFDGIIPDHLLWRQKEQFSDGVGYSWIDSLKLHAEASVSDRMMENAALRFPDAAPTTKEAYFYRDLFESHFPQHAAAQTVPGGPTIACSSSAAIAWDASFKDRADPSGRFVKEVHNNAV